MTENDLFPKNPVMELSTWPPISMAKRLLDGQIIRLYSLEGLEGFHSAYKHLGKLFLL